MTHPAAGPGTNLADPLPAITPGFVCLQTALASVHGTETPSRQPWVAPHQFSCAAKPFHGPFMRYLGMGRRGGNFCCFNRKAPRKILPEVNSSPARDTEAPLRLGTGWLEAAEAQSSVAREQSWMKGPWPRLSHLIIPVCALSGTGNLAAPRLHKRGVFSRVRALCRAGGAGFSLTPPAARLSPALG